MHAERIVETSGPLCLAGLDGDEAARIGLTADERFVLRYFTDLESQTIDDLRDLISTRLADDPEVQPLRGYERIESTTANPVLAELCRRIALQERRHFAFDFNGARRRLAASRTARRLTRWLMDHFFTPVGSGVKPQSAEVARLFGILFPGEPGGAIVAAIDARLGHLPGLEGNALLRGAWRAA